MATARDFNDNSGFHDVISPEAIMGFQKVQDDLARIAMPAETLQKIQDNFARIAVPAETLQKIHDNFARIAVTAETLQKIHDNFARIAVPAETLQKIHDNFARIAIPAETFHAFQPVVDVNVIRSWPAAPALSGQRRGQPVLPATTRRQRVELSLSPLGPYEERVARRGLVSAYSLLVDVERTLRHLIVVVLRTSVGPRWWRQAVPEAVRDGAVARQREAGDSDVHAVDFLYIDDLRAIIRTRSNWVHFHPIFGNETEFEACFNWLCQARPAIGHARLLTDESDAAFRFAVRRLLAAVQRFLLTGQQ